jgi:hypothetical protein
MQALSESFERVSPALGWLAGFDKYERELAGH